MPWSRERSAPASLEIDNLSKDYGALHAVDDVTLHVQAGEFLTLLGPSGSGKTTTLRLVAGFLRPTSGTVKIDSTDITNSPPHAREIGMVFQNYALFPHMTAAQNIAFPLQMRRVPRSEQKRMIDEALELVQLGGLGDRSPRQLSGGQQQRIAFARATVFRPRLLLMDEPLGALDRKLRESMQLEIRRLHDELGITILHVTHDQEEAMVLSDRIALFDQGKIEQIGPPTELYERPASVFVAGFLGESNIFHGKIDRQGGGLAVVGNGLRLRCEAEGAQAWSDDDPAALVVRPERVVLADADSAQSQLNERIEGIVRQVIYLGSTVKYQLEASDQTIFARADIAAVGELRHESDRVAIEWPRKDAVLVRDRVG